MKRFFTPGRITIALLTLLLLIGAAAFYAPDIDASPLQAPMQDALSRTLGRPVTFREVQYQVFPAPGLKLLDLVIPEDPQLGREPIAYVTEMQVGISWRSLTAGTLLVSSVRLVDSSLNVSLSDEQGWNVVRLLRQMKSAVEAVGVMPAVELEGCRINFRSGYRKSSYFLNTVDLELDSSDAGFAWSFEASPARTDRAEQGFGRFTGKGKWTASPSGDGALDIDIELEPSALSEVTQFLAGRDLGLQGRLASRVKLGGPPRALQLSGNIELAGLDRPALFGLRQADLGLPIEGRLDVPAQTLLLKTAAPKAGEASPVAVEFTASSLFSQPAWSTRAQFDGLPAPTFLDLTRKLGARVPAALVLDGRLSGQFQISAATGLDGELTWTNGTVRLGEAGPLAVSEAAVKLAGGVVQLEETTVKTTAGNEVKLRGSWSVETEALGFQAESGQLTIAELLSAKASLPDLPQLPLLSDCTTGEVAGALEFERGPQGDEAAPGDWQGELQISGLECPIAGASRPITVQRGQLAFRKGSWTVRRAQGDWGGMPFSGEASLQPAARRPFRFVLTVPRAEWSRLESLLEPALRRRRSLLERTLPFRRSAPPSWLAGRHAEGRFEFRTLQTGETSWTGVKGSVFWDGSQFEVPQLTASLNDARLEGRLRITLAAEQPEYHLLGNLSNWPWLGGTIDADIDARMRGFGPALEQSLRAGGNFRAVRSALPELPLKSIEGAYDFDDTRRPGRLRLAGLDVETINGETMTGQGQSLGDGQVQIELSSARRGPVRSVWPLSSLRPSAEPAAPR